MMCIFLINLTGVKKDNEIQLVLKENAALMFLQFFRNAYYTNFHILRLKSNCFLLYCVIKAKLTKPEDIIFFHLLNFIMESENQFLICIRLLNL